MTEKSFYIRRHFQEIPIKSVGDLRIRHINFEKISDEKISFVRIELLPNKGHESIFHEFTHEWIYVLRGSAKAIIEGETRDIIEGSCLYIRPGTKHAFHAQEEGVEAISIFFPPIDWKKPDITGSKIYT